VRNDPGAIAALSEIPVIRASSLEAPSAGGSWSLDSLVGILSELSEEHPCGALSFCAEIIQEAQERGEPVAWVASTDSVFFPPDFAARGIDLRALAVIRAGGQAESLTAGEWLVKSGAVGLLVVDCGGQWTVSDSALGRLQKLAERSQCAVLFLTRKPRSAPSLGSRIAVRGCVAPAGSRPLLVDIHTDRDKRAAAGPRIHRCYHAPPGMR